MTNFNKSFSFSNGVQVDYDNFIVNPNGLVGIGTTVPTEFFDLYGNAKITGLVTATNLAVTGVSTFYSDVKVGSGITFYPSSGIVSATTFYGSAAGLTGFYAVAVNGWYVDNTNSGIFTSFKVGIGTTTPQYSFQVGQDPIAGNGVSVDGVTGNIKTTGIITASAFGGNGASLTALNASNISSGTLSNSYLPSNISVSGVITATSGFVGNLTGTATTASNLTGTPNITVANVTSSNINNSGIITSANINNSGIITSASIRSGISSIGISTVYTRLYAESIGVGTNSPASDIHIRRTSTSTLQLTSDSAEAIVALGRSTTLAGSNGALRYGNTSALQRYSTTKSLDIINYDTGNINSYLQLGSTGINTGSFNWFYGQTVPNSPLMTLTYGGSLGIGVTSPTNTLHVVGTSTVTNNAYVGSNLYVASNLYVSGTLNLSASMSGNLIGNVTGNVTGNVYAASGISTFNQTTIQQSTIQSLGIVDSAVSYPLEIGSGTDKVIMDGTALGISTTTIITNIGLDASNVVALAQGVGIGTTNPKCYADFANAGTRSADDPGKKFMLPPKVSSADRVGLTTVEGAVIYNTTVRRLELYLGTGRGWVGVATVV
jgi:hypothetical protein